MAMRGFAWSLLASPLILLVAACGSSDPPRAPVPLTSIKHSRAHLVAPLLTIRAADLPEFKVAASNKGPQLDVQCPGHRRSSHRPARWASVRSQYVAANSGYHALGAWSYAQIMPTAAAARLEVAEARRRKVCVEHALRSGLLRSGSPSDVRGITVEPIQVKVNGADASAAYRAIVAARHEPLVIYLDATVFSYGQDVFVLGAYHSSKPVPSAMEERLQALLIARARSHGR
jgi:hypothetical protein